MKREGVSPSYFTRLVRLSYLAPDITHAILDGRQPRDLTADKLLALSRLPLAWCDQRAGVPFAALASREGVSPSYFTRLVRLSYLAPDILQAILDGRQPPDLSADKLLAHSRLPLAWWDQRAVLGFIGTPS